MKLIAQQIISIFMSVVVLAATMSFTIEKHFCGDMLIDTAIMHKSDGCAMEEALSKICDTALEAPSCCSDEHITIEGLDNVKLSWDSLNFEDQSFIVLLTASYFQSFKIGNASAITFEDYAPPLIVQDI